MIVRGTVIGLSSVRQVGKYDKKTTVQQVTVDIPRIGYEGCNALSCTLFGSDCDSVGLNSEVLCEVDNYVRELRSIVSIDSIL